MKFIKMFCPINVFLVRREILIDEGVTKKFKTVQRTYNQLRNFYT